MTSDTPPAEPNAVDGEGARSEARHKYPNSDAARLNAEVERLWLSGEVTFEAFDWWLRSISGV